MEKQNNNKFSIKMQKKLVVLFIFVMLALSILIVRIIMLTFESGTLYQKQVLIQQQYDSSA